MPEGFMFPDRRTEFWSVLKFRPDSFDDRSYTYLFTVGRLRDGVTIDHADAELDSIGLDLERQFPVENERMAVIKLGLCGFLSPSTRTLVVGMADAAFCLLFFFNNTATTEIYTLSLHDALPI